MILTNIKATIANLFQILRSCLMMARMSRPTSLKRFVASEESCYILGNGPSLKADIEMIPPSNSFVAVNSFSTTAQFARLKPKLYILVDPAFWNSKETSPSLLKLREDVLTCIRTKTAWEMHVIIPVAAEKDNLVHESLKINNFIEVHTFNNAPITGPKWFRRFFYNRGLASPRNQNVLVAAIYVCIMVNFRQILLLGADHSWHEDLFLDIDNVVCLVDKHFYDSESSSPQARPFLKSKDETFSMSELFNVFSITFNAYEQLSWFANEKGVLIVNRSSKSYIDAFKRIPLTAKPDEIV